MSLPHNDALEEVYGHNYQESLCSPCACIGICAGSQATPHLGGYGGGPFTPVAAQGTSFGDGLQQGSTFMRASSAGSFQSAHSTQPTWNGQAGSWYSPPGAWATGYDMMQQQDLPQMPLPGSRHGQEVSPRSQRHGLLANNQYIP